MRLSELGANAAADAVLRYLDGGYLRLLSTGGDRVAELRFGIPAFRPAARGIAEAAPIAPAAASGGVAARFVAVAADGLTTVFEGSVGDAGSTADVRLSETNIEARALVVIDEFRYQHP